jgi:hypothetical protein
MESAMTAENSQQTKPEARYSTLLAELEHRSGQHPVLKRLLRDGRLPTVEEYIDVNWWGELPEEIDVEEQEVIELLKQLEAARET